MDGRVSDFDDIFILFMKMEMESGSRLGSKHEQKILEAILIMYLLTKTNIAGILFFLTQHVVVFLITNMESAKSDVNVRKTNKMFFATFY